MTVEVSQISEGRAYPIIDPEMKEMIPPLKEGERAALETSIREHGCRDALVVWDEENTLLDGHNRLEICLALGIEYQVKRLSFENRAAALVWIIKNQMGRRNLHPDEISRLRGKRYQLEKQEHGGQVRGSRDQNEPSVERTANKLAAEFNVSPATIKRDAKYAAAVDVLESVGIAPSQVVAQDYKAHVIEFADAINQVSSSQDDDSEDESSQADLLQSPEPKPIPKPILKTIEKVKSGKLSIADAAKKAAPHNHRAQGTGENEWYTPAEYLDAARAVLGGIDLDPASSPLANQLVGAQQIFTIKDDGLNHPWRGRVWMNPPYSQPAIAQFADKLATEWEAGSLESAIALTHNYTDTAWFHRLASACAAICFTRGRIGFVNPQGEKAAPTQGQAFFYFGQHAGNFRNAFRDIGFVVEVAK